MRLIALWNPSHIDLEIVKVAAEGVDVTDDEAIRLFESVEVLSGRVSISLMDMKLMFHERAMKLKSIGDPLS
ncbi:hypothetical protein TIFTF001_016702 [Ficus carica]|uniref:Uncharacterized protein n=1 Tax=Ficus carica TaxID=3494 RepID=A0AA88A881_FICCA|nr:hypothetical protein TIFTF001_016702 [Ficus carica]